MAKKLKEKKQSVKSSKVNIKLDKETLKRYFNQKTFAGISVVGLLTVLILYVFVFLSFQIKTEELEAANAAKQIEVNELEEYYNNLTQYEADIQTMTEQIKEALDEYPADAREEDILMLAVQTQEKNAIGYDSINMELPETVLEVPAELVTSTGIEGYTQAIRFVRKHAIYVNTTTYADLKNVIGELFDNPNRVAIDNIVYTKNEESGLLEGSINVYLYSVTGTNKEYEAPQMTKYPAGTTDIFKSGQASVNTESSSQEAQEADTVDESSVTDEEGQEASDNS